MDITLNGERVRIDEPFTVLQLVKLRGYRLELVAVELNGAICPKRLYGETQLHDADVVEIVSFVGGG